jgi:hypothetical protein
MPSINKTLDQHDDELRLDRRFCCKVWPAKNFNSKEARGVFWPGQSYFGEQVVLPREHRMFSFIFISEVLIWISSYRSTRQCSTS